LLSGADRSCTPYIADLSVFLSRKNDGIVVAEVGKKREEMVDEMYERPVDGCREVPAELPDAPITTLDADLTDIRWRTRRKCLRSA